VEYEGEIADPDSTIRMLDALLAKLVAEDLPLEKRTLTPEEAEHQGIWAPPGKSARTVNFAGYAGCGCGGTHVRSTGEIGRIEIRKIHFKKGVTRVSYALA
jgi:Ser-tRNA(Ala) deacylase AlaX